MKTTEEKLYNIEISRLNEEIRSLKEELKDYIELSSSQLRLIIDNEKKVNLAKKITLSRLLELDKK
jgi:hypothetical protein